jgi:hypothetical protein
MKQSAREWNRSFLKSVPLEPGEVCEWKRHFLNVLREVIGYLESQAAKNESRFVWARIDIITKRCNRYNTGKPYSEIQVKWALAFLKKMGIIARVRKMKWKNQNGEFLIGGYIVSPHDQSCVRLDDCCQFLYGGLTGLGYDRPGAIASNVFFHPVDMARREEVLIKAGIRKGKNKP